MKHNPETQLDMSTHREIVEELPRAPKGRSGVMIPSSEPSVAMMLQKVIDGGITKENVTALESLVGLYDRMQFKKSEREFNEAFAKLQSELGSVDATRTVPNKDGTPR